ncbi:hypothetical protein OS493_022054 [Desmophyllum pertusum]|uniref:HIRAN domain-containing protein n=1 Tax=Desmophyllum pertusum TaxID=174260 RepID=A0A9X0CRW1_9CNID|nr:hypothetical protein OS493_022054 [Desmophyllum pertusum]
MATISVENAVVKGHHVYLSEVRIGDIFDCFPEVNNLHDPHAMIVMNAGNVVGHLPEGFAEHIHSLFAELKENITVLCEVTGNPEPSGDLGHLCGTEEEE